MEALKELIISLIRTVIMPLVAGGIGQLLILSGVDDPSGQVRAAVATLIAVGWYLLARWLETKNRYWGLLLLVATTPRYDDPYIADELLASVRRTVIPLLVGWSLTLLAKWGFDLDEQTLTVAIQAGITSVYYAIIRVIERSKPAAGVLIGGKSAPYY